MQETVKLLLPALIPSWRFFDKVAPSPRIEFTLLKTPCSIPERWQEFRPRPAHLSLTSMFQRMFWNPRWNETLFLASCAERLMENGGEHSSREIVKRIQAELGKVATHSVPEPYLQFRLLFISRQRGQLHKHVTFISPVYPSSGGLVS